MLRPRWKKVLGDMRSTSGRIVIMVIAIAVGISGVGTILTSYTILTREISRNYLSTNPASVQIEVDKADSSLARAVKLRPGIADAEPSSAIVARIEKSPGEWMPALLFVIDDFDNMRINKFTPESGAWPPPTGTMLLEREALPLVKARTGNQLKVQTPNGPKKDVIISGLVHDPGLAPAWQEQTAYGYITPSTLAYLCEPGYLHILKLTVKNQSSSSAAIEKIAADLAGWLRQQGHKVGEIRIPPPGKHPHQTQMMAILVLLLVFSFLALALSAILAAAMIGGMLAQQVRQIGVMKAIGARTYQIACLYLVLVLLISVPALLIGVHPGIAAGRGFAKVVARLLNFTLYSEAVPTWVFIVQLLTGILVPVIAAFIPILAVTRTTVRKAINDYGINRDSVGSKGLGLIIGNLQGLDRTVLLSLRNTFRRKGRLMLTLGLLAVAGGLFIGSLNVKKAWERYISDAASKRRYDLEVRLSHPVREQTIMDVIASIPEVLRVETWNMAPAAVHRPDNLEVVRTYPDRGHGSFALRSVPAGSDMIKPILISGRWIEQGDIDAVVLNHMALTFYPQIKTGDQVVLNIDGHPVKLRVVGIIRQILTPATAYVSPGTFARAVGGAGKSDTIRISLKDRDASSLRAATREIEQILEKENIGVKTSISEKLLDTAQSGHVYIFIFALLFMAGLMAVVGTLGLMSAMGTNVTERTREIGVMRAIGAKSVIVIRNVIFEGMFIGIQSWIIAILLSVPLSIAIGRLLGNLAFRWPLPLSVSPLAISIWLVVIILGSIGASAYPAWRASRLTIRESLFYE